jgi:hypothetical protein
MRNTMMKKTTFLSTAVSLAMFTLMTIPVAAQDQIPLSEPIMQGPATSSVEARPEGGFSKSIAGKWDCGDLGTLQVEQRGKAARGTYSRNKGKLSGVVESGHFKGQWREEGKGRNGTFDLAVSIERMTPEPTHLRGKWKKRGEKNWRADRWVCKKD